MEAESFVGIDGAGSTLAGKGAGGKVNFAS